MNRLEAYGRQLKAAGFRVWVTPTSPHSGYLTYARGGFYGHLQSDYWGNWSHDMPLVPSRENGSAMFVDVDDVWSVAAAEKVAREHNTNPVVGRQRNAAGLTWVSPASYEL